MTAWHWYRAHGLTLRSQIPLPELTPTEPGTADVSCSISDRPATLFRDLPPDTPHREGFIAHDQGQLMPNPWYGPTLIPDTGTILVSPVEGQDPQQLRLYLTGSVLGMVLHMRGRTILHGAGIVTARGLSVFVGPSGAGKSTLAAHMARRGYPVLSDDVTALEQGPQGGFQAWPGTRVLKICHDALEGIGAGADLPPADSRSGKHFLENQSDPADQPVPLADVIALQPSDGPPSLTRLSGLEAMALMTENIYRPGYVDLLERRRSLFTSLGRLLETTPVYRFERPWDPSRHDEVAAFLAHHWADAAPQAGE